jgi:diguanylate cyclase (GGDEF)-like protein/PAS domain S-box-containing protein
MSSETLDHRSEDVAVEGQDVRLASETLAQFSNPVAVLLKDGTVSAANAAFHKAAGLLINQRLSRPIRMAVGNLIDSGGGISRVGLETDHGERVYDLTYIPAQLAGEQSLIGANGAAAENTGGLLLIHDQTLDSGLRNALTVSRARYKEMVEISSDYAWEVDHQGCFSFIAPQGLVGYAPRDLIGRRAEDLMDPDHQVGPVVPFSSPTPLYQVEAWLRGADGTAHCLEFSQVPLLDKEGIFVGARGVCRDLTGVRRAQAEAAEIRARDRILSRIVRLFRREAQPETMIQAAASAITHGLSATGCQLLGSTTPAMRQVSRPTFNAEASFGRVGSEKEYAYILSILTGQDDDEIVLCDILNDRRFMASLCTYGDRVNGAIIVWRDYVRPDFSPADQKLLAAVSGQIGVALEQLYNHRILVDVSRSDALTGLLNRRAFYEDVQRRIRRLGRSRENGALMYVDLDNFKQVNDTRGHEVGDEVLRRVGEILRGNTRGTDIVARLGGDEFAIWLDAADEAVAAKRADVFLAASAVLRKYSGSMDAPLMLSIGVAVYNPDYQEDMNQFISRADAAMYAVKKRGKGSYGIAPPPPINRRGTP